MEKKKHNTKQLGPGSQLNLLKQMYRDKSL